jgi:ankyrin repeat protein
VSDVADYASEAETLFRELQSGSDGAAWCFKWDHPRFKGKDLAAVRATTLQLDDARLVIARTYSFDTWADLETYVDEVSRDGDVARFEAAVEAVVSGDADALRSMLAEDPGLARARSSRSHHATLLHYVAANGVEGSRQKTPPNAVEIARILLDAGAEPDALADMYDAKCTTMSMLVSSAHPAGAGVQAELAELLLDRGAAFEGPGSNWRSALLTALAFGYRETAERLAKRGAPIATLAAAAGLGRLEDAKRLLPKADARERHAALAVAAQHGQADVVRLLLDAGEDPNRYNPEGYHGHSTPLHQAVWAEHMNVVRLLVERGARLDLEDTLYRATPLGWATYGEKNRVAEYLREQGAK